jgi:hypothetical protein
MDNWKTLAGRSIFIVMLNKTLVRQITSMRIGLHQNLPALRNYHTLDKIFKRKQQLLK